MKLKSWIKYFVYALIILGLIVLDSYVLRQFSIIQSRTYTMDLFLLSTAILIYMMLGSLIGAEHLVSEVKKEGRWKFNLPKFIFLVIPFLYLSLGLILFYSDLGIIYKPVIWLLLSDGKYGLTVMSISQILFGYFTITSFYKQSKITE